MVSRPDLTANQVGTTANRGAARANADAGLRDGLAWRNHCSRIPTDMRAPLTSRLRLVLAALALALAGGLACTTPSVPLPPPLLSSLSFQMSSTPGMVVFQGAPAPRHANVRFYVYNRTQNEGVITKAGADGAFTTEPFPGVENDSVQLYFEDTTGELSQNVCTTVHFGGPLISSDCF
jgi:hypothetical protein